MVTLAPNEVKSTESPPKKVLVAFENSPGRERALQFCERVAAQNRVPPDIRWLPFASVADTTHAQPATDHAVRADIIIFAANPAGDFPTDVKLWSEQWLNKRSKREGAIIGLIAHPPEGEGLVSAKELYLRHLALRAGMDYLSQSRPTAGRAMPDSLDSFCARAGQMTSVLNQILHTHPTVRPLA